jgi:hypothetical protein
MGELPSQSGGNQRINQLERARQSIYKGQPVPASTNGSGLVGGTFEAISFQIYITIFGAIFIQHHFRVRTMLSALLGTAPVQPSLYRAVAAPLVDHR